MGSPLYVIYLSFLRKRTERGVLVKPPVEEDSSITDLDEIASSKDSDEPGTICKKEALVEVDDDLVDSDRETL